MEDSIKKKLDKSLSELNEDQKEAAFENGNCMVLAGPGSGKTKMIASKAARLLYEGKKVTAVTFTKDSALEIRKRILSIATNKYADNLLVGTFHGICYQLLSPPNKVVYGKNILPPLAKVRAKRMDIATGGDKESFVQRAFDMVKLSDHAIDIEIATFLIEQAKAMTVLNKPLEKDQKKLFEAYQDVLKRNYKIDFQDLITDTVLGLRMKSIKPLNTDYLLVDEYQDTDEVQYEFVSAHVNAGVKTTIVGDDDQSIYGWRQALGYVGMENFANKFNANRITLNMNYRCKSEILNSAVKLVEVNKGRLKKDLKAFKGAGGSVKYIEFNATKFNDGDTSVELYETDEIAKYFKQKVGKETCAVIARTNANLDDVEEACIRYNVPYLRQDGGSILDKKEASIFAAVIDIVCGKSNKSGIDNVLSWVGLREETLIEIHQILGDNIVGASSKSLSKIEWDNKEKTIFNEFNKRVVDWKANLSRSTILVIEGISKWLISYSKTDYQLRIIDSFANILNSMDCPLEKSIDRLKSAKKQKDENTDEREFLVLITAHSSKGLEWDSVWVVGVNQDGFPNEKSGIEEERRLMYVAMTRARNSLVVSSSKTPSQFIDEAGLR